MPSVKIPSTARFLLFGPVIGGNDRLRFGQIKQALGQGDLRAAGQATSTWVQEEGWRFSPQRLLLRRQDARDDREFDERYGIDSAPAFVDLADVQGDNFDGRYFYLATTVAKFRRMLARLKVKHEDFTFIDLGSGKGRTVLLAGERPFKRVIGVEYSRVLHEIAQQNIEKYPLKKAGSFEAVLSDVMAYDFPPGPLVVYNYNSFGDEVLTRMLENLDRSAQAQQRPIFLIFLSLGYFNPAGEEAGLAYGETLLNRHHFVLRWVFERYRMYEWVA
ncbi:MAG: class I SAM-dependent methyltransferase [Janthinobacterium lividum]